MAITKVHIWNHNRAGHYALCGAGYVYPSSIAFVRDGQPANCKECLAIQAKDDAKAQGLSEEEI